MSKICPSCGLPKELCVCETIAKEEQKIKVRLVKRRFGKVITLIEGIDEKNIDMREVARKLKEKFACGGTIKNGFIELQGDHTNKVKKELIALGFSPDTISQD